MRWAIGDLLGASNGTTYDSSSSLVSKKNARRIAYLFEKNVYNLPNRRRPVCHRAGDHTYKSMDGRLRWDPAQTITTGFGSMGQGRYVHLARRRTITPHGVHYYTSIVVTAVSPVSLRSVGSGRG